MDNHDKGFLGQEFLTWLYFFLDESDYEVELPGAFEKGIGPQHDRVAFAIGKRTVLTSLDQSGVRVALSGPDLDDCGEVLQALRRGALVETLELQMALDERVYTVTLKGRDAQLSSVRFFEGMVKEGEGDASDVLDVRLAALDEIDAVIDGLFARFVTRRLAQAWQKEDIARMQKKVAAGLASKLA